MAQPLPFEAPNQERSHSMLALHNIALPYAVFAPSLESFAEEEETAAANKAVASAIAQGC